MLELTKRRFVQLAGLSIAHRILPGWLLSGSGQRHHFMKNWLSF